MREIDKLAHALSWEHSTSAIYTYSIESWDDEIADGNEPWQDISGGDVQLECKDALGPELRYIELRGALVRHPTKPNWIQIGEPNDPSR